jgi:hypothetical protein
LENIEEGDEIVYRSMEANHGAPPATLSLGRLSLPSGEGWSIPEEWLLAKVAGILAGRGVPPFTLKLSEAPDDKSPARLKLFADITNLVII